MKQIITDDAAMVETMKRMLEHFGATLQIENLENGRFRLIVSEDDIAKVRKGTDA